MRTIDCSKEITGYHGKEVTLPQDEQKKMRERRNNGRTRLQNGLTNAGKPQPKEFSSQGSYAMRTMVQDNESDYDIDDGVYFEKDDLQDDHGNNLGAQDARQRVRKALKDNRLACDAVVKTNCVRQKYPEGYHIDIPVYRVIRSRNIWEQEVVEYELASGEDWVKSDARKVTRWYNNAVGSELKTGESDSSQLRRVTKLTKKMARSRSTWKSKTTSGICLTKFVVDNFVSVPGRDDDALRDTWKAIRTKLALSLRISHPVYTDMNLAEESDTEVAFFRDCLDNALQTLQVLDDRERTRKSALNAWDGVFNTTYFSIQVTKEESTSNSLLRQAGAATGGLTFPNEPVTPNKSSGFA